MNRKDFRQLIQPYIRLDLIVMVIISLVVLYLRLWYGVICLVLVVLVTIYHAKIAIQKTERDIEEIRSEIIAENDEITRNFVESCPVYMCVSDISGNISWSNEGFRSKILTEGSIAEFITQEDLQKLFEIEQYEFIADIRESKFRISSSSKDESTHSKRMIYFEDVTPAEIVRDLFKNSRPAFMNVNIDNYDELLSASPVENQSKIIADIDKILRDWIAESSGSIVKIKENQYSVVVAQKYIDEFRKNSFSEIMEKIHGVETEADFPTTISIGVGTEAANYEALALSAYQALDLALGRGGDQVVIKKSGDEIEYFGGSLANIERRNKGKSRIMSHALVQLIQDANNVLVMGHSRPDLDSFGAAIGVASLATAAKKKAYIVLNAPNEAIDLAYDAAVRTNKYEFVSDEIAMALAQKETLLVIVDTHIGPMVECPQLLEKCKKLVVIDHHRKSANAIENTLLTYMEPFASSASEQVCELLQYAGKLEFGKFEMDALLAGITLDTKNFTQNTGARTFESASWLRRNGADTKNVMNFFKMRLDFFQKKVNMIASAQVLANEIAVAYTKESDPSMQVLAAQAADELLTMRGISAVFVAGSLADGRTTVSARSNGKLNVQVIMEKLGGGGHINVAAAQMEESPEMTIQKIVQLLREEKLI